MSKKLEVLVVIPARGGSKRIPRKNILPVLGKPMIFWVTDECKKSKYVTRVVVSTEDNEIKDLCINKRIEVIDRPKELAEDNVEKMEVIVHVVKFLEEKENYLPDMVVSLQPNSPEFLAEDLDKAIEFLWYKVHPKKEKREVISINKNLMQNACFRIMTRAAVFQRSLSTNIGVYITDYMDIHEEDDISIVEERITKQKK